MTACTCCGIIFDIKYHDGEAPEWIIDLPAGPMFVCPVCYHSMVCLVGDEVHLRNLVPEEVRYVENHPKFNMFRAKIEEFAHRYHECWG